MARTGFLYLNGRDANDFGFLLERIEPDIGAFDLTIPSVPLVGHVGRVRTSPTPNVEDRVLQVRGWFYASTRAGVRTAIKAFREWCSASTLEIVFGDDTSIAYYGVLRSPNPQRLDPQILLGVTERWAARATLTFDLTSGLAVATSALSVIAPSGTYLPIPTGGGPSQLDVWVYGRPGTGFSNPTVALYDGAGELVKSVAITATFGTDDYFRINGIDGIVTKRISPAGVTYAEDSVSTGDPFMVTDPARVDRTSEAYYTLLLTTTSGGSIAAFYRKTEQL